MRYLAWCCMRNPAHTFVVVRPMSPHQKAPKRVVVLVRDRQRIRQPLYRIQERIAIESRHAVVPGRFDGVIDT